MLFLVLDEVEFDNVAPKALPAQIDKVKQTFKLYEEMKVKGKLKLSYAFADLPGWLTIWEVESNEELQQILYLSPSMTIVKRSVRPLTEMKSGAKTMDELSTIVSSIASQNNQHRN